MENWFRARCMCDSLGALPRFEEGPERGSSVGHLERASMNRQIWSTRPPPVPAHPVAGWVLVPRGQRVFSGAHLQALTV